jgi:hypothetical protein
MKIVGRHKSGCKIEVEKTELVVTWTATSQTGETKNGFQYIIPGQQSAQQTNIKAKHDARAAAAEWTGNDGRWIWGKGE